ncbi:MAG: hypothetical protein IH881_17295 [Myxococcales bacterium]|nr:hypothetical protein [Myxococcales bacterium]
MMRPIEHPLAPRPQYSAAVEVKGRDLIDVAHADQLYEYLERKGHLDQ